MRAVVVAILVLCFYGSEAQQDTMSSWHQRDYTNRPTIGLALSGGAAHGLAHIGVIRYMEEIGIPVDYITGTSMGAIIGAMYAIGYDCSRCTDIVTSTNWDEVLSTTILNENVAPIEKYKHEKYPITLDLKGSRLIIPEGIINSSRLELLLDEILAPAYNISNFDSLSIPYRCYAVDIVDGSVVELGKGKLARSVRASMAIPSIFSPISIDDRMLVDGGLIRNLPVSHCKDMGADIVIASYVGSDRGDAGELGSLLDILKQSAFMMSISDSEYQQSLADVLLLPDVKQESTFDFNNHELLIRRGYEAAEQQEATFIRLKELLDQYDRPPRRAALSDPGFIFIDNVVIEGVSREAGKLIREKIQVKNRSYTTFTNITKGIEAVYATKNFDRVDYELDYKKDGTDLILRAGEVSHSVIGTNINHFSSTRSALLLSLQARNLVGRLTNVDVTARVSENPGIFAQLYKRRLFDNGLVYGISSKIERLDLPFEYPGESRNDMKLWEGDLSPFIMWEISNSAHLRLRWTADFYHLSNFGSFFAKDFSELSVDQYNLGLDFVHDRLDKPYFTTKGHYINFSLQYAYAQQYDLEVVGGGELPAVAQPQPYLRPRLDLRAYHSLASGLTVETAGSGAYRSTGYLLDNMYVGGTYQDREDRLPFIGLQESDLHVHTYGYGRAAIRYRVNNVLYTSLVCQGMIGVSPILDYVAPSVEEDVVSLWGAGLSLGMDLPTGPVYLDLGYTNYTGDLGLSFSIGYRHIY